MLQYTQVLSTNKQPDTDKPFKVHTLSRTVRFLTARGKPFSAPMPRTRRTRELDADNTSALRSTSTDNTRPRVQSFYSLPSRKFMKATTKGSRSRIRLDDWYGSTASNSADSTGADLCNAIDMQKIRRHALSAFLSAKHKQQSTKTKQDDYDDNFTWLRTAGTSSQSLLGAFKPDDSERLNTPEILSKPMASGSCNRPAIHGLKPQDLTDNEPSELCLSPTWARGSARYDSDFPSLHKPAKSDPLKSDVLYDTDHDDSGYMASLESFAEDTEVVIKDLITLADDYELCEAERLVQEMNNRLLMIVSLLVPSVAVIVLLAIYGRALCQGLPAHSDLYHL